MRALLKQALGETGETDEYFDRFVILWNFIDANLIDHNRKGWYDFVSDAKNSEPGVTQSAKVTGHTKAYMWKDASHEVRALVECVQMLEQAK